MPYSYEQGRYIHAFPEWQGLGHIERNLITFASARTGKGATQIVPFLHGWAGNALVIDPKGEAAELTAERRAEKFGQESLILDPFKTSRVRPDRLARYNPLDDIDPAHPSAFRQINAMADGLVMRHDPKGEHWEGGGVQVLAGFIAHVLTAPDYADKRNLITVRKLVNLTGAAFKKVVDAMAENSACSRLPQTAANKLMNTGKEAGHFLSVATSNTLWLDDPYMEECLSSSTFSMCDFKCSRRDIFLVLPFDTLADYGRFLRLFVRLALYHMQQKLPNGDLKGRDTFFILDEFYSLGFISEIAKTVGGMPGFNLHLWPFLQDMNQLNELYSKDGAGTFLSNCDAAFFFGVGNDEFTAPYLSNMIGRIQEHELEVKPPLRPQFHAPEPAGMIDRIFGNETDEQEQYRLAIEAPVPPQNDLDRLISSYESDTRKHQRARSHWELDRSNSEARYQDDMNIYAHARSCVGHPRVSPEEVRQITKRNPKRKIADNALVLKDGVCYIQPLKAYFESTIPPQSHQTTYQSNITEIQNISTIDRQCYQSYTRDTWFKRVIRAIFREFDGWRVIGFYFIVMWPFAVLFSMIGQLFGMESSSSYMILGLLAAIAIRYAVLSWLRN